MRAAALNEGSGFEHLESDTLLERDRLSLSRGLEEDVGVAVDARQRPVPRREYLFALLDLRIEGS